MRFQKFSAPSDGVLGTQEKNFHNPIVDGTILMFEVDSQKVLLLLIDRNVPVGASQVRFALKITLSNRDLGIRKSFESDRNGFDEGVEGSAGIHVTAEFGTVDHR